MDKAFKIIKKDEFRYMRWSGGEQVELYIYPEDAVFEKRNFLFDLCTATVENDKSTFTLFPGYDRLIMTLEGSFELTHNGGEPIVITEYQPHAFYGGDVTVGIGRPNDYNLVMASGKCGGALQAFSLSPGSRIYPSKSTVPCKKMLEIYYVKRGRVKVAGGDGAEYAECGELIVFDRSMARLTPELVCGDEESIIVRAAAYIY